MRVTVERHHPIKELGSALSRRRLDDIESLSASIALEGLRLPVLLLPSGQLLKGRRRIAAAEVLGWTTIQARTVRTIEEAAQACMDGRDQDHRPRNVMEKVALGLAIESLPERQPSTGRDRTYDIYAKVGPALGWSGSTYKRARWLVQVATSARRPAHLVQAAVEALAAVDAGTHAINGAYTRVRNAEKSTDTVVVDGLGRDGLPMTPPPQPAARSPKARRIRQDWVRAMAAKGATSADISDRIGITVQAVKKLAQDTGVEITADRALAKTQRRAADPNRAMEVVAGDLDALVWSLDRVELAGLDPDRVAGWAETLRHAARSLNRVAGRMKKEQG